MRRAMMWMLVLAAAARPAAQGAPGGPPSGASDVEADPIRCWWRTSAGAVRVGEPFSLILTCAIVDNESTTVVPDRSRIEPSAVQLPPFEVIGGQRAPDLQGGARRFFQYEYRLRLISDELFGKDVHIPSLQIAYHIESRVERGEAVRGRDRTYLLPALPVRILSLVPSDAADIRDLPAGTFADIEAERLRARTLLLFGGVLYGAAALVAALALVRWLRSARGRQAAGRRLLSDLALVRGLAREMASLRRAVEREGWTPDLAGRALAAFRLAGSLALGRPVAQQLADGEPAGEGQIAMRRLFGRCVLVSGSATTEAVARELAAGGGSAAHRRCLEQIRGALACFTAARFGRETALDEAALAEALADGPAVARRLAIERLRVVRRAARLQPAAAPTDRRAWSR